MKTIRNIILAGITAVAMSSCSDFLDLSPHNTLDPETTMTDDVAKALTLGCYRTLQSSNMYNQRIWTLDIVAGNSEVGAGGGTDGLETVQASNFITQTDNAMALYLWRSPWVGIGQCNTVIRDLNSASGLSEEVRSQSLGEAYFLRAHYYYILVRLFGGVPLRLEPFNPGDNTAIARNTKEEVYEQIIKDCQEGINRLPAKADYSDDDKGRACREAAMAMMADIYLTTRRSTTVRNLCLRCSTAATRSTTSGATTRNPHGCLRLWGRVTPTLLPAVTDGTYLRRSLSTSTRKATCVRT